MPRFEPFRGLRYAAGPDLGSLVCPPYDVIDDAERAALEARDPRNAIHIELPVGDDAYVRAGEVLANWRESGVLAEDAPSIYAYRMTPPDSSPVFGFLGALGVTDEDGLLPHERTTPKAKSDRLDLLRATRVNTSPIWALSLAAGLSDLYQPDGAPLGRATDASGVLHELFAVPAAEATKVTAAIESAPAAVADGHHRWETTRNYLRENPGDTGADRILALVVELAPERLEVRPIHRLIASLPEDLDLATCLSPWFESVGPADAEIVLVNFDGEVPLRALPATRQAAPHDADAERLQVALDALGVTDLSYPHDPQVVRDEVAGGRAAGGFLLRPVSVEVISAAARAAERFPPKTTFFWPKPMTGFVFRSLDG